jgi:hypothetical protein
VQKGNREFNWDLVIPSMCPEFDAFPGKCLRTTYLPGTNWMNKVDGTCQPVEQPLVNVCRETDLRPSNETVVSNV